MFPDSASSSSAVLAFREAARAVLSLLTFLSLSAPCSAQGGCDPWKLTIRTDAAGQETTWTIVDASTSATLASGGPYPANYTITVPVCVPQDGCFVLNVHDAGANGMAGRGYVLCDHTGKRVIDNAGNGAGFTSDSQAPEPFCSPVGSDRVIASRCDHEAWFANDVIYASENPAVSAQWGQGDQTDDGYQFWFFDPNGGYTRKIYRNHADPAGHLPADALRATKLALASIASNPLPHNRLLNVRVRARVNGVYQPWGAACRFKIDETTAMCMPTRLISTPGPTFSCGRNNLRLDGTDMLWAVPVNRPGPNGTIQMANKYRFRFENASEAYIRNIAVDTYWLTLVPWPTSPLEYSHSYDVSVQASYDNGATWCPWGSKCQITFAVSAAMQRNRSNAGDDLPLCWPNPNDGGLLQVQVPGEAPTIGPAQLTLHDLSGRLHLDHQLTFDPDGAPRRVDLGHTLPAGIYLVQLHTTSSTYTERLLIAPR